MADKPSAVMEMYSGRRGPQVRVMAPAQARGASFLGDRAAVAAALDQAALPVEGCNDGLRGAMPAAVRRVTWRCNGRPVMDG